MPPQSRRGCAYLLLPYDREDFHQRWRLLERGRGARHQGCTQMNPNPRRGDPRRSRAMRRPQNDAGNARQHYERYLARAREAQLTGDAIEVENWYQHAEHYFRMMKGAEDERRG